jgi:tellurite resistance protein
MSLYNYFKPASVLPTPDGPLSKIVPSSSIRAANEAVQAILPAGTATKPSKNSKKRGTYQKYSPKEKARIGNYAVQHGTSAALRHYSKDFPDLKWTTVNDWRQAIIQKIKKDQSKGVKCKPVEELEGKKRGRPSTLSEELNRELMSYIRAIREAGGIINTAIVIAAATGMLQKRDPMSLECNGGHITLKKGWAKYFLGKMNYVKRKATTKSKLTVQGFEELKQQYLLDIKAVVDMEEIPHDLIINWDQTGINYVPVSQWTMTKEGSKRVEIVGVNDKRQITAVFAGSLAGDFLPVQLVYQGKTKKCLPCVEFPANWHVTATPNHWCNEVTTLDYVQKIIIPYINKKKKELGMPATRSSLVIFDEFNGQTTDAVLSLLQENNICYVIVPPNCTDRLQPLDVSANKPAKEFLRSKFQAWYADKIASQLEEAKVIEPVNLKLSIMKPIGAKWMIQLFDYFKTKPEIIQNGFKGAGIMQILSQD